MTTETPPIVKIHPIHNGSTTQRGMATASLCLGLWGFFTFWMYPFGFLIANIAIGLGVISVLLGIRAGREGEHLAWWGIFFGACGAGAAFTVYRFFQLAFDGIVPTMLP